MSELSKELRKLAARVGEDYSEGSPTNVVLDYEDIVMLRRAGIAVDDYRECFASLARERDGLWEDLERVTRERDKALRGAANCDDVLQLAFAGLVQNYELLRFDYERVTKERDEARRLLSELQSKGNEGEVNQ